MKKERMVNRLVDRVAIVSGGRSGIGRGVAVALAREGTKVVICGRRRANVKIGRPVLIQTMENPWE